MPPPIGLPHAQLPLREVHVTPFQRHHLPAPKSRFATEEHDQVRPPPVGLCRLDEALVVSEIMNAASALTTDSSLIVHGMRSMTSHSTAFFSSMFNTVNTLFTVLAALSCKADFSCWTSSVHDVGTQYRSAIFFHDEAQKRVAEEVKAKVQASGKWKRPIVTEIVPARPFYSAEDYHQKYLEKNPGGYTCHYMRD